MSTWHTKSQTHNARNTVYSVSEYGDFEDGVTAGDEKTTQKSHLYHSDSREPSTLTSARGRDGNKFYQPASNRTWVLCMFLAVIALYIVLIELALATHGHTPKIASIQTRDLIPTEALSWWVKRDGESTVVPSSTIATSETSQSDLQSSTFTDLTTTSSSDSVLDPPSTVTPGQPPPDLQITLTSTTSEHVTGAPNPNNQVTVTSQSKSNDKVTATPPQPQPLSQVTVTSQAAVDPSTTTAPASNTGSGTTVGAPYSGSQVTITSQNPSSSSVDHNSQISSTNTAGLPSSGSGSSTLNSSKTIMLLTTTNTKGSMAVISSTIYVTPTASRMNFLPTTSSSQTSKPTTSASKDSLLKDLDHNGQSQPLTQFVYFCAVYLPTLLAILLQSGWLIVYSSLKAMEPFYQLAQPGGAPAISTLTADYLSCGISFTFVKTAIDGHWVMCLAGVVQLLLVIIVSFSSKLFDIVPTEYCKTEISDRQPCNPVWIVEFGPTRGVEVLLVLCFGTIVSLTYLNRNRLSGVYSDPTRIATIADLLTHKPLIQEIRDLPPNATKQQIEFDLADSRYMLGTFDTNGRAQYGIMKLNTEPHRNFGQRSWLTITLERFSLWTDATCDKICKDLPLLPDFLSMTLTTSLLSIILAYFLIPGTDKRSFNMFMNSGGFMPGFLLTSQGVCLSVLIQRKERLLRLSHPYVLMSRSPSKPASQTILAGTHESQYVSIWLSFLRGDFMLASLSIAAFFCDMMIVLLPGIPWTLSQTAPVYRASTFTCLGLLIIMFLIQLYVAYDQWQRRDMLCHDLPDTIANVMQRLCASRFVEEKNILIGAQNGSVYVQDGDRYRDSRENLLEFAVEDDHRQRVGYGGYSDERRYRFACMEGIDGVHRFMVEEDTSEKRH